MRAMVSAAMPISGRMMIRIQCVSDCRPCTAAGWSKIIRPPRREIAKVYTTGLPVLRIELLGEVRLKQERRGIREAWRVRHGCTREQVTPDAEPDENWDSGRQLAAPVL